jgi:hypothetical protein
MEIKIILTNVLEKCLNVKLCILERMNDEELKDLNEISSRIAGLRSRNI